MIGVPERQACDRNAIDGQRQLGHDLWLFRVAEIKAVGGGHRGRAGTSHLARRFGDRVGSSQLGVQVAPAFIAVERHGQAAVRTLDAHHARLTARALHRIGLHHRLVLLVDPVLGADIRGGEQSPQFVRIVGSENSGAAERFFKEGKLLQHLRRRIEANRRLPLPDRPAVQGSIVGERLVGNVCDQLAMVQDPQPGFGDHLAHDHRIQSPLLKDADHFVLAVLVGHQQHALLAFAQHDLVGGHARFPLRHVVQL